MIGTDDSIGYQTRHGPWGSHLHDGWVQAFNEREGRYSWLFAGYLDLITGHNIPESPITLRILYASRLIAEAYCEPHDHIRLVRLISALETLAVLEGEKSDELARRCGLAGGWSSDGHRKQIETAVSEAYKHRNAIVHGDPEAMQDYQLAFLELEKNLIRIFVGFSLLYIGIHETERPRHVKELRRAIKKKIEPFFYDAATARNLPNEAHVRAAENQQL
nr:HEPN domain-containing protein [Agrobacterium tumefaciens]